MIGFSWSKKTNWKLVSYGIYPGLPKDGDLNRMEAEEEKEVEEEKHSNISFVGTPIVCVCYIRYQLTE